MLNVERANHKRQQDIHESVITVTKATLLLSLFTSGEPDLKTCIDKMRTTLNNSKSQMETPT